MTDAEVCCHWCRKTMVPIQKLSGQICSLCRRFLPGPPIRRLREQES